MERKRMHTRRRWLFLVAAKLDLASSVGCFLLPWEAEFYNDSPWQYRHGDVADRPIEDAQRGVATWTGIHGRSDGWVVAICCWLASGSCLVRSYVGRGSVSALAG